MDIKTRNKLFPIFNNYPNLVYLDSAATTQKPRQVIDRIKNFYEKENANVHRGIYDLSEIATQKYENARSTISKLFPQNYKIIFTSGTTQSANLIAHSYLRDKVIITSNLEHHSNFLPFRQISAQKVITDTYNQSKNFKEIVGIDYKKLLTEIKKYKNSEREVAIVITAVNNVTGEKFNFDLLKQEIEDYEKKPTILIDAAQWIGHEDLIPELSELNPEFIYFSGHKLLGPTGIGVTAIREDIFLKVDPYFVGGGMIKEVTSSSHTYAENEEKLEAGTPNIAGAIGLASATEFLINFGLDKITKHELNLVNYMFTQFKNKLQPQGFHLIGMQSNENNKKRGVFSFYHEHIHAHDIADLLNSKNIAVRAGHHCNQILHSELLAIPSSFRVSFHLYNNKIDIDKFTEELIKAKEKLKL